jgi:hypothetical protein
MRGGHGERACSICLKAQKQAWYLRNKDKTPKRGPARGERSAQAKLTDAKVRECFERHDRGERGADIARAMGVSQAAICNLLKGRTWTHLQKAS